MMIPRVSYFPLVYDKLEKLYSRSVSLEASEKELWLSSEDIPLKWQVQTGLCYGLWFIFYHGNSKCIVCNHVLQGIAMISWHLQW